MHQVSLETISPLKAFQLHYCPDNDAKSIMKHFIFLHKFTVIRRDTVWTHRCQIGLVSALFGCGDKIHQLK